MKENAPEAAAALTICESLLVSLEEQGMLSNRDIHNLLTDAAEAHRQVGQEVQENDTSKFHSDAADFIERIRDREDTVRAWRTAHRAASSESRHTKR